MMNNKISLLLLLKRTTDNLPGDIDEVVLQVVYGNSRQPPGDQKSPSQQLRIIEDEEPEEDCLIG